jgi:hypothetical protein
VHDCVKESDVRDIASFLLTVRETDPRMFTIGTSLSDGVAETVFVDDEQAPRKLHSVTSMLYCWPSIRNPDGIGVGGVSV